MNEKFEKVVDWLHQEIILAKGAPGFIVGLSGTDSIVTFMAASQALERVGKADRLMGVHFAPSEEFLLDYPEAEKHLWFNDQVIPWLRNEAPFAKIVVDTSIDWRYDGARWGTLADMSVIAMPERKMRPSAEKYWVLGTRNLTEDLLFNYSIASTVAVVQPIIGLWKSDVLDICEQHLKVPSIVIKQSCEADCICGREEFRAKFGRELDIVLNAQRTSLDNPDYRALNPVLANQINAYIRQRVYKGHFKTRIPYVPKVD